MSRFPTTIKPTWLDRAVATIAPAAAVRRLASRLTYQAMTGGYTGARSSRRSFSGWHLRGGSADAEIVPDLATLRDRTRDLTRNSAIAGGAINRVVTNVVGAGLALQPQLDRAVLGIDETEAADREREIEREYRLWSEGPGFECDITGVEDFGGMQDLVFRAVLEGGDCFVVERHVERRGRIYPLALQVFEADQVSTPNNGREGAVGPNGNRIVGGIELDRDGRPVAGHFLKKHPGNIEGDASREWARVPFEAEGSSRKQVLHLFDRTRVGQTRGVPYLAPVIENLKQLTTLSEAELMAAVVSSMVTVVFKTKSGQSLPNVEPTIETGASTADRDYKIASGAVLEIEHDDEVSVPNIGRPNLAFDPFFVAILRQIGANLEIPFEVLIQHFTSSYSASRAALEMAWQFFRVRRKWLATRFNDPVYCAWFDYAVALGRIKAPGYWGDPIIRQAWRGHQWIGPGRISIDPKKENEANVIAEDRGWKTATGITAETTGGNWENNMRQRGREERLRAEVGAPVPEGSAAAPEPGLAFPIDEDRPDDERETNQ